MHCDCHEARVNGRERSSIRTATEDDLVDSTKLFSSNACAEKEAVRIVSRADENMAVSIVAAYPTTATGTGRQLDQAALLLDRGGIKRLQFGLKLFPGRQALEPKAFERHLQFSALALSCR